MLIYIYLSVKMTSVIERYDIKISTLEPVCQQLDSINTAYFYLLNAFGEVDIMKCNIHIVEM
jgi:hypothetical protein